MRSGPGATKNNKCGLQTIVSMYQPFTTMFFCEILPYCVELLFPKLTRQLPQACTPTNCRPSNLVTIIHGCLETNQSDTHYEVVRQDVASMNLSVSLALRCCVLCTVQGAMLTMDAGFAMRTSHVPFAIFRASQLFTCRCSITWIEFVISITASDYLADAFVDSDAQA